MEIKEFYNAEGKLSSEVSFITPTILMTKVVGPSDETSATHYSGYVTHLFESGGLQGMIVDAGGGSSISPEAISILSKSDAFRFVKKIGVYGVSNPIFKIGLQAIIQASGRDNIKILNSQDEAMSYVQDGA